MIISDRYDLWQFNPKNGDRLNLTSDKGRAHRWQLRHMSVDYRPLYDTKYWREKNVVAQDGRIYMTVYDEVSKKNGLASVVPSRPSSLRIIEPDTVSFLNIRKSLHAPTFVYCKGNFRNAYDLYLTKDDFAHQQALTRLGKLTTVHLWMVSYISPMEWTRRRSIQ